MKCSAGAPQSGPTFGGVASLLKCSVNFISPGPGSRTEIRVRTSRLPSPAPVWHPGSAGRQRRELNQQRPIGTGGVEGFSHDDRADRARRRDPAICQQRREVSDRAVLADGG